MSAAAILGGFASRQRASEGLYFSAEGQQATVRHLEKLVGEGKVDASVLKAAQRVAEESASSGVPTSIITKRSEYVYEHKKGLLPARRFSDKRYMQMGTKVSLGRAKWTSDGGSIFSVADGKRLAQTPLPNATYYESLRMNKIERAAMESPTMAGYRLLPKFTPGRAMLWGSVLAVWGVAAAVATTARQLDIHTAEEAPSRMRVLFRPVAEGLQSRFAPLRNSMSINSVAGDALREDAQQSELVKRLRTNLMH